MPEIVVSDTSCLILLTNIGDLGLLNRVYGEIIITPEIANEYKLDLPGWMKVISPSNRTIQNFLENYIDRGEASALALANELKDCIVILDDFGARKMAEKLGLRITGTLGIILKAKKQNIIPSVKAYIDKLRVANYRISEDFIIAVIKEAGEL